MKYKNEGIAGILLFVGGIICVLGIIVTEALYLGYSTSQNYISDLGVGPSAYIFNSSMFFLGVLAVVGAYFLHQAFKAKLFSVVTAIAGIGVMGVGLFPEDVPVLHTVSSLIAFLFSGLSAVISYKVEKPPFSYFSVVLGAVTLLALLLFTSGNFLGLGVGGMERMIAYPALLWVIGFGGYLLGHSK